jgi:hypothetical protein
MAIDHYANYVIQTALNEGTVAQRNAIAKDVFIVMEVFGGGVVFFLILKRYFYHLGVEWCCFSFFFFNIKKIFP